MKEIKFRAWYLGDIEIGKPLLFEQKVVDDELFFVCKESPDIVYPFYIPFIDDDWIVEQSIGIKDKNGKEIYNGDMVIYDYTNNRKDPIVGIVEYENECASYGVVPLAHKDSIKLWGDLDLYAPLEVVGNIHEKTRQS